MIKNLQASDQRRDGVSIKKLAKWNEVNQERFQADEVTSFTVNKPTTK